MAEADVLHADEFRQQLQVLSDAAISVFAIRTREPFRALWELRRWSSDAATNDSPMAFKVWSVLTGWQGFPNPDEVDGFFDWTSPSESDQAIDIRRALQSVKDTFSDGCYAVFGAHWMLDDPALQQHIKNLTQHCIDNQKRVVFIWPESVNIPPAIEDDLQLLDFKTPSLAELREVWEREIANIDEDYRPNFDDDGVGVVLRSALGMSQQEFANSTAIALVELSTRIDRKEIEPMDFSRIILRNKTDIIKRTDILELLPEADISEIGGLDILKQWIGERADAMISEDAHEFGIDPPKGVLIVGPPGGGKSLTAKAIASVVRCPGIKFDIGRVFGSLVGQSEQRTRKALALIDAMAPCVVLLDEIDKGLGGIGGSGDSGTSQRVLGTILNWMQERSGPPVFLVMTANNVIGLPPELMRKGRLDEIFAVTFPSDVERADIARIHVEKRGHEVSPDDLREIAKATDGFVGAEIEAVVKEALIKAYNLHKRNEEYSLAELCVTVAKETTPLKVAFAEKVGAMNEWAKNNARPASTGMTFEVAKPATHGGMKARRLRPVGPVKPKSTSN